MSIADLTRALRKHPQVSEFVVREVREQRVFLEKTSSDRRGSRSVYSLEARIFVDARQGRGESRLRMRDTGRARIKDALDQSVRRAAANIGPSWKLPAPAAPARVHVADDSLFSNPSATLSELATNLDQGVPFQICATTRQLRCVTSAGFDNRYRETTVGLGPPPGLAGTREFRPTSARRVRDLVPKIEARDASPRTPVPAGTYDLVVASSAFGEDPRQSIFSPFIELGDAERYRQGLGRIREGQKVVSDGFSLRSDGAIDYAPLSKPFDADGGATRRYPLIESGVLAGLALDARAAGLLGREPNGGIGNLIVETPTVSSAELLTSSGRPILIVDDAAWIRTQGGTLSIGIRRARLRHRPKSEQVFAGGVIRTDALELFARPIGSHRRHDRGWVRGPALLRLGTIEITA